MGRDGDTQTLPRGRHKLSRKFVREDQRARLVLAMLDSVVERGYAATSISAVVASARVSRNTFYELFEDKASCYLAACDEASTQMLTGLYALPPGRTWIDGVRAGTRYWLSWWQDHPGYAIAYLVDMPTAGRAALAQRDRAYASFAEMFERVAMRARAEMPDLAPLAPLTTRLLVAGMTDVLGEEIRAGRMDGLDRLEADLAAFVIKVLGDDSGARMAG